MRNYGNTADAATSLFDEAPVQKVVATGFSLVVGLSDNSQITFQSGFEGDEPDEVVNARIDRILRIANRQRAIGEIDTLERDLLKQRSTLSQFKEDFSRIESDHARLQAQRRIEIDERISARDAERKKFEADINGQILQMQEARQDQFNAGLGEHQCSGRSGSYKPAGQRKVNLEHIDLQIGKAKGSRDQALAGFDEDYAGRIATAEAEMVRADAERDQAVDALTRSMSRYEDEIAITTENLDKAKALAGG